MSELDSFTSKMEYLLDVQGFKHSGDNFIVKELAILPIRDNAEPQVYLFKPPFPWHRLNSKYKCENIWLERNYHALSWNSGVLSYDTIGDVLRTNLHNAVRVLVMGSIKKKWLERFKYNVHDIIEMGYPPLDEIKLRSDCPHHNRAYRVSCAHRNVGLLKRIYEIYHTQSQKDCMSMEWE